MSWSWPGCFQFGGDRLGLRAGCGQFAAWQQGSRSQAIAAFLRAAVEIAERSTEAFAAAAP